MATSNIQNKGSEYWEGYTNHQKIKHRIINDYLKGWFAKLAQSKRFNKIVYLDTHAGRGKHKTGERGSPLVALYTLLEHSHRDKLLENCNIEFQFIERDNENLEELKKEIENIKNSPSNITIRSRAGDCYTILNEMISLIREKRGILVPAFIFVDPYGFKVPYSIFRDLLEFRHVEVFINVIWRELNMALAQGSKQNMSEMLNQIFAGVEWQKTINSDDFDERIDQTAHFLKEITGAKWSTYIQMEGGNKKTRYFLLHLTNHDDGRDLMKECIWKACPGGGYRVPKTDDSLQLYLIPKEPDLRPLRKWIISKLNEEPRTWQTLQTDLRPTIWLNKHLNEKIRELKKEGIIKGDQYTGVFSTKANPRLIICSKDK